MGRQGLNLVEGLFESKNYLSDNSMRVCDGLSENFLALRLDLAHKQHESRARGILDFLFLLKFLITFAQVLN